MSFLIYILLDIISSDKNYIFQPPPIGLPLEKVGEVGMNTNQSHHICVWNHTIELYQTYDSGKYLSHLRTSFGLIPGCDTPYI